MGSLFFCNYFTVSSRKLNFYFPILFKFSAINVLF